MKPGLLFFLYLFLTLHLAVAASGNQLDLHLADSLIYTTQTDSVKMESAKQDSFFVDYSVPYFQMSPPQILPDSVIHQKKISFFRDFFSQNRGTYTRRGTLAAAILANWAAFYLRRRADDYYGKYRRANRLKDIQTFYDKTAEFDRYSNAMLVVSGVALSTYLYFLFSD